MVLSLKVGGDGLNRASEAQPNGDTMMAKQSIKQKNFP